MWEIYKYCQINKTLCPGISCPEIKYHRIVMQQLLFQFIDFKNPNTNLYFPWQGAEKTIPRRTKVFSKLATLKCWLVKLLKSTDVKAAKSEKH